MSNTYAYLIDLESLFEPIGSFVDLTPVTCHAT